MENQKRLEKWKKEGFEWLLSICMCTFLAFSDESRILISQGQLIQEDLALWSGNPTGLLFDLEELFTAKSDSRRLSFAYDQEENLSWIW